MSDQIKFPWSQSPLQACQHILRSCLLLSTCLGVAMMVSACRNEGVETLALDAGNAIAANKAIHTVDPWSRAAFRRHQTTNGKRMVDAYEKYEAGPPPAANTAAPPAKPQQN